MPESSPLLDVFYRHQGGSPVPVRDAAPEAVQKKMRRDVFLYMEPKGDAEHFAQCGTCRDFIQGIGKCYILNKDVTGDTSSCGAYVHGAFTATQPPQELVPAEEVGLVHEKVRCENCRHVQADKSKCGFFATLNEKFPELFDLDVNINLQGCCNGMQP